MNATELVSQIKDKAHGFTSLYVPKNTREHTSLLITLGRLFPTTKAQAVKVCKKGYIDVLYNTDVTELIEPLMIKHGFNGDYYLTKSGRFCRLRNFDDFAKALKLEFKF